VLRLKNLLLKPQKVEKEKLSMVLRRMPRLIQMESNLETIKNQQMKRLLNGPKIKLVIQNMGNTARLIISSLEITSVISLLMMLMKKVQVLIFPNGTDLEFLAGQ
jgi:hypothetical protein